MANSLGKYWIGALLLGSTVLAAQDGVAPAEIVLDMQSFSLDNKTNLINLRTPVIKQGDMSISADQALASSVDFAAKSEWRFTGHVRITLDTAVIRSDSAVFTFDGGRLARGELDGQATFEDAQPGATPVSGGAGSVVYDYPTRTLRLTDKAWVHKGQIEAQGCDLLYNLTDKRITSGTTDCDDRFLIRVLPKQGESAAAEAPPP